jgi:hypothetical protein
MAYMAEVGGVDGIIALVPGHSPRHMPATAARFKRAVPFMRALEEACR